jgi:hypothetical protein
MGFFVRYRANRAKLKHVRSRAAELLPLCEKATGIKLEKPLKIERSSRLKHVFRYAVDVISEMFRSSDRSFNRDEPEFNLGLAIGLYPLLCLGSKKMHSRLAGYYDPIRGIMGMNLDHYTAGDSMSDYTLAHEISHVLLEQHEPFVDVIEGAKRGTARTLAEGGATYYGEIVTRQVDPAFDVSSDHSFQGAYKRGYRFFAAIASALGNPLTIISTNPPDLCMVRSRYGTTYLDDEVDHPDLYIQGLQRAWHDQSLRIRQPSLGYPLSQVRIPLS